jgi:flagellar basal body P-ring formation protein FlgA
MILRALLVSTSLLAGLVPAIAEPLRLKAEVQVDGDTVRLGHLIEGLEQGADIAVFRAPAPGARGTIRAERILAAAREMGVEGVDPGALRSISITRRGRTISRSDLQDLIARTLVERGAKGDLDVVLDDQHTARTIDVARTEALKVMNVVRDTANGRFEAKVALAGEASGETWVLTGSVIETREIAVPASDLERGDAVQAKDLILIRRPAHQIGSDILAGISDLVGMVPRRTLRAGEMVHQNDLAKPILVEKNQLVMVIYAAKGLNLQMRGRAQASAAMGEAVRVQNPQSKRMVEGLVTGPGVVTILSPPVPPANLADATPAPGR